MAELCYKYEIRLVKVKGFKNDRHRYTMTKGVVLPLSQAKGTEVSSSKSEASRQNLQILKSGPGCSCEKLERSFGDIPSTQNRH